MAGRVQNKRKYSWEIPTGHGYDFKILLKCMLSCELIKKVSIHWTQFCIILFLKSKKGEMKIIDQNTGDFSPPLCIEDGFLQ